MVLALVLSIAGCVAVSPRHIGGTATSAYLRISRDEMDNRTFQGKNQAYILAPIGFLGVVILDTLMLPITLVHDCIATLRQDADIPAPPGTFPHTYRGTIRGLIVSE
jgi:uncharacterized protein YceK